MLESARANLELMQYQERDVSPAEVRRLFDRGKEQIRARSSLRLLQPPGDGRLERPEPGEVSAISGQVGEPVIVQQQRVEVSGHAAQIETVEAALERFEPKQG